ncbi:peptide chain release factor N(5)-glutamine methyltransferase [Polyangium aurulentum]|uniref:peptide chain release factor N(5)-glutamine methyltransferase n=1 Tax=Polyangium aurulentum TaxID=2567896 RepID=UPI0010AE7895|nr:peptide chain release factor N(5)-glutamine methyltransferase [Polyangium aurulentum]UQA61102.1 peptide chain release factor N(5)-glutamine methyltransferase [Polyangium aurulentum]
MTTSGGEGGGDVWTIRRVLAWASEDLKKRGFSSPRLDVELLLCNVLRQDRVGLIRDADKPLEKAELARYRELYQRRRAGEPVAYLLGVREFYGRPFRVDRRVLIPRPDTETLVEVGLLRSRHLDLSARVLDLCTGSGCVAISLAKERPTTCVIGLDLSPDAAEVARENVVRLGAVNCAIGVSDLFSALSGRRARFDLITANPPYIPDEEIAELPVDVRGFEPHLALSGGADGLSLVRRIVKEAPDHLAPGGVLALEVMAGQAPAVREIFSERGFVDVLVKKDLAGHERVVSGVWHDNPENLTSR